MNLEPTIADLDALRTNEGSSEAVVARASLPDYLGRTGLSPLEKKQEQWAAKGHQSAATLASGTKQLQGHGTQPVKDKQDDEPHKAGKRPRAMHLVSPNSMVEIPNFYDSQDIYVVSREAQSRPSKPGPTNQSNKVLVDQIHVTKRQQRLKPFHPPCITPQKESARVNLGSNASIAGKEGVLRRGALGIDRFLGSVLPSLGASSRAKGISSLLPAINGSMP